MDMKLNMNTLALLLLFLTSSSTAQSGIFDVTKYGATPNADITEALTKAWKEACASTTPSKIVIPGGTYKIKQIQLAGPCVSPIEVQVDGTIQAPENPNEQTDGVWVNFWNINFFTLSGKGTFDGLGAYTWKQYMSNRNSVKNRAHNLAFMGLNNSIIRDITSKDSKYFHIGMIGCHNITYTNLNLLAPAESINTDGIHGGKSSQVNIINSNIATGDDCVSIGDGMYDITVENVTCGPGHGFSVGSLGKGATEDHVKGLIVRNCIMNNTDNGARIKTWADAPATLTVSDIHFENIEMINVRNPIIIDQEYCPSGGCKNEIPSKIKISNVTFKNIKGTTASEEGVVLKCSRGVPCEVEISDVDLSFNGTLATTKCANAKTLIQGNTPTCAPLLPKVV